MGRPVERRGKLRDELGTIEAAAARGGADMKLVVWCTFLALAFSFIMVDLRCIMDTAERGLLLVLLGLIIFVGLPAARTLIEDVVDAGVMDVFDLLVACDDVHICQVRLSKSWLNSDSVVDAAAVVVMVVVVVVSMGKVER